MCEIYQITQKIVFHSEVVCFQKHSGHKYKSSRHGLPITAVKNFRLVVVNESFVLGNIKYCNIMTKRDSVWRNMCHESVFPFIFKGTACNGSVFLLLIFKGTACNGTVLLSIFKGTACNGTVFPFIFKVFPFIFNGTTRNGTVFLFYLWKLFYEGCPESSATPFFLLLVIYFITL
jgi:hypothetical protein